MTDNNSTSSSSTSSAPFQWSMTTSFVPKEAPVQWKFTASFTPGASFTPSAPVPSATTPAAPQPAAPAPAAAEQKQEAKPAVEKKPEPESVKAPAPQQPAEPEKKVEKEEEAPAEKVVVHFKIEDLLALRKAKQPVRGIRYDILKQMNRKRSGIPSSEHGWKKLTPDERNMATHQIPLILNRLASTNCDEMTKEILKLDLSSVEILKALVKLIYEKAVKELLFVKVYAKLCGKLEESKLHERVKNPPKDEDITFRKLLTDHCKNAFEKDMAKWKNARSKSREGLSDEDKEILDFEVSTAKARYLGNIQFIAQLFLVKVLSVSVLANCIVALLKSNDPPEEECIETVCKLMESVGKPLQEKLSTKEDNSKEFMNIVFKRFKRYYEKGDKYPPRIRFLLLNTIELRETWTVKRPPQVARSTSPAPLIHAPTPQRSLGRSALPPTEVCASTSPAPTPLLPIARTPSEVISPPVVSPDPFKITAENQTKAMNTISTELMQYLDSHDREEFMAGVKEGVNKELYSLIVPATLRFVLKDNAKDALKVVDTVKTILVDFVDEEGVKIKDGLDYFKNEFLEYGEDSPSISAKVTGMIFSALCKNDSEGAVFHAVLSCLANLAYENPFWNAPNKIARSAGFAATALVEMFSDIVEEQKSAGRDPYADLCGMIDRESADIRSVMPDSSDAKKSTSDLVALLKDKSLEPLFPALCDPSLVIDPLSAAPMQPLTPEKLSGWIEKTPDLGKGARSYSDLLIAEEVFRTLKTTTKDGNVQLTPWIPVLIKLAGTSSPIHYQVGLLNAMCLCWLAVDKKAGALKAMASLAKDSGLITKFAFDRWRVDSSDKNFTLKDEAYNNELTDLF